MKRVALRRGKGLKRTPLKPSKGNLGASRRRLSPFSTKRRKYQAEFHAASEAVRYRSGAMCEARIENVCTVRAIHVHHRLMRSSGGGNQVANLLHLCRACHEFIHAHPEWSRERGFILRKT